MRIMRIGRLSAEVQVGELTVIALSDGETAMPLTHLRGLDGAALPAAGLAGADVVGGKLRLPVRAFLVRGEGGCLLIDTGAADAWHPGLGQLEAAMAEAGIAAEDVTDVALTHTHIDHLSGLVRSDGTLAFPNAPRVLVPVEELGDFRADPRMAPAQSLVVPLEQGDGPMPGVIAINAPGHSPGHMVFEVAGRLLIWGDVVHHAAVQFAQPDVTWTFDSDPAQARQTRERLLARVVADGLAVAGAHLPGPGIGKVVIVGEDYSFVPITPFD
jgi:glyoxylase-like metal-dependent hydrolase (beta-lactamase superfamily II)